MRPSAFAFRLSSVCSLALAFVLTGCGIGVGTGSGSGSAGGKVLSMSGQAHGGRQPVIGATVSVYAAGNTGYGLGTASSTATTLLATATTDANGNFAFSVGNGNAISCPASSSATASPILYVVASGGQPITGLTNAQSVMMSVLGDCRLLENVLPFISINELSTFTAVTAMQQFAVVPASGVGVVIGAPATKILGLTNAAATAGTLLSAATSTGGAMTLNGGTDSSITGATITITAEATKINLAANVLAACINTNGTGGTSNNCATLFSNVGGSPTDTLQAAYYMAKNPTDTVSGTSNIANVYGLAAPQSPYQTAASTATDWTLGLTYGTKSQGTATILPYLMESPEYVAADGAGNIWIGNYTSGAGAQATTSSVLELSPTGIPQKQVLVGAFGKPAALILDPVGNVFVADALNGRTVEYTTGGATSTFATAAGTYALASDGAGNIFVANKTAGNIQMIPAGSSTGATPTVAATLAMTFPSLAFDTNLNLWVASGTGVSQFLSANSYASATTAVSGAYESIGVDPSNNIWSAIYSSSAGALSSIPATNTSTIAAATTYSNATGLYDSKQVLSDSVGNIFVVNQHTTSGAIVEYTNAGVLVSPAAGFAHTYDYSASETIDQAGNVWIGSEQNSSSTVNGFITEIVGIAAPTVAPLAAQLPSAPAGAAKTPLVFSSLPAAYTPQGYTFTYPATVAVTSTGINPSTATGVFSLSYNGTTICSTAGPFTPGSSLSCVVPTNTTSITSLPVDPYTLLATYSGDSVYAASSTPITLNVQPSSVTPGGNTTGLVIAALSGPLAGGTAITGATATLYATQPYGVPVISGAANAVSGDVGPGYYAGPATVRATGTAASTPGYYNFPPFSCSNVDEMYVVVNGGTTSGGTSQSTTQLMTALGPCSTVATMTTSVASPVVVNEVTTAAAAYTLAGFMSLSGTTVNITASANNYATTLTGGKAVGTIYHPTGLQHAFLNAANLASITTGAANTTLTGYPVSGSTVVPVLPTQLLNSVGNTLATCVQVSSSCTGSTAILNLAVPLSTATTLPVPATTLGAALNIARNPFMNGAGTAAYWANLATINPYGTGTSILTVSAPATVAGSTLTQNTAAKPHDLSAAIFWPSKTVGNLYGVSETLDANDNLYINSEVTATTPYYYELIGQSSSGTNLYTHQFCQTATYVQGSCQEWVLGAANIAADQLGYIWLVIAGTGTSTATPAAWATTQAGLIQLTASTGAFANIPAATSTQESIYNTYSFNYSVAVDQANDVWVGTNTSAGDIFQYAYTPTGTNTLNNPAVFTVGTNGPLFAYAGHYAYALTFDNQQNLFSSSYSSTASTNNLAVLSNNSLTSSTYTTTGTGATAASYTAQSSSTAGPKATTQGSYDYGVAVDAVGNVYETSGPATASPYALDGLNVVPRANMTYTSNVITAMTAQSTQIAGAAIGTSSTPGLVNTQLIRPTFLAPDGDGAIWAPDTYLDAVARVYGPTGTSVMAYYPCVGTTCYNFASNYTSTTTGLYGAKFVEVDSTGTLSILTAGQGIFVQLFGVGTPSFPLLQSGKPSQMP